MSKASADKITRRPAEVFPPGEFLRDELNERGWSDAEFAARIGEPVQLIHGLITGNIVVTPVMARKIAAELGTSSEFWLNLEATFQQSRDREVTVRESTLHALKSVDVDQAQAVFTRNKATGTRG